MNTISTISRLNAKREVDEFSNNRKGKKMVSFHVLYFWQRGIRTGWNSNSNFWQTSFPKARIILRPWKFKFSEGVPGRKIYPVSFFHHSLILKLFNRYFSVVLFLETGRNWKLHRKFHYARSRWNRYLPSGEISSEIASHSKDPFHERFIWPFRKPRPTFPNSSLKSIRKHDIPFIRVGNSIAKS